MEPSVKSQTILFFLSVFLGFGLGFLFDFVKTLRIEFKKYKFIQSFLDILYIFISGAFVLIFLFYMNGIELRIFLAIGIILGLCLYFLIFSNFLLKVNKILLKFLLKSLEILLYPVKILCKIIYVIIKMIKLPVLSLSKFLKKQKLNIKIAVKKLKKRQEKV